MDRLEPWGLSDLVPYQSQYLSGFRAESYQVGLEEGFNEARKQMDGPIRDSIRSDIGGDEQRIQSMRSSFSDITFKHILLPVWISAYRYRNKSFRFLVNARTGEVQGERPWSWMKIGVGRSRSHSAVGIGCHSLPADPVAPRRPVQDARTASVPMPLPGSWHGGERIDPAGGVGLGRRRRPAAKRFSRLALTSLGLSGSPPANPARLFSAPPRRGVRHLERAG